jgi:hypothetical protein
VSNGNQDVALSRDLTRLPVAGVVRVFVQNTNLTWEV